MGKRNKHKTKVARLQSADEKITLCNQTKCFKIKVGALLYCAAHNTYTFLYIDEKDFFLSTKPLSYWERRLPDIFWRIHKHLLINSAEIKELLSKDKKLKLQNMELPIARRRRKEIRAKYFRLH